MSNNNEGYKNDKFYIELLEKLKSSGAKVVEKSHIEVSSEVLGSGRNTVFKGKFEGKNVAVKVKSKLTIKGDVKSFIREITIGQTITHQKIPKVICVSFYSSRNYRKCKINS